MTQVETSNLNFKDLKIDPELLSVIEKYFTTPTPIQAQVIPVALEGKDVVGIAQTGTGKTLAFGIPLLQKLSKGNGRGLILVPTRELAQQVAESIGKINKEYKKLQISVVIGGASSHDQIRELRRSPKIVVATPGRLVDHLTRGNITLDNFEVVVLDEADRMFDIGFMPQIKRILKECPTERETLLFSATMPEEIAKIATLHMKTPLNIEVAPSGTTAEKIEQEVFIIERENKFRLLEKILKDNAEIDDTILIFVRTKHSARKLTIQVRDLGVTAAELHSNRSLFQRKEALQGFKSGKYRVLICTDIASRGIDVKDISIVLNYDLPDNTEDYVHRIGRTGRAGKAGRAITFATHKEKSDLRYIERLIRKQLSILVLPELPAARPERTDLFIPEGRRELRNSNRREKPEYRRKEPVRRFSSDVQEVDGTVIIRPQDNNRSFDREKKRDFSPGRKFQDNNERPSKDYSFNQFLDQELSDFPKKTGTDSRTTEDRKVYNPEQKRDFSARGDKRTFSKTGGSNFKERISFEKKEGGNSFNKFKPSRPSSSRGGFSSGGPKRSFGGGRGSFFRGGESADKPSFEKKEGGSSFNKFKPGGSSSSRGGFSSGGPKRSFGGGRGSFFRGGESSDKPSFEKKEGGNSFNKFKPSGSSSSRGGFSSGGPKRSFGGGRGSFFRGGESSDKPSFEKKEGGSSFNKFKPSRPSSSRGGFSGGGPKRSFGGNKKKY